ncbi:DUF1156 domain-containing protein [Selenomonas sputigena]|uniref:DUF1156 domain-containing protein n=1 Tax=Selenomonas sputigena TaxID=69823 RepID=UPI00222FD305|nr:DUF1156 domain-containing protein [Selenomonas sputigena]UZD43290.1 DUF1156 domain-containing protein [Selenomonas sputigena]
MKKKLIEVAIPLDAINAASAREKSIRHGHPSTLHLWWARRPLATARAVLFASLVDDPSSHPEEFPTEEAQDAERQRLFRLLEKLVVWENSGDKALFAEAYEEIKKSTGGNPPPVFDPFAGGGTIPLEAQRLGLKAIAADLNPVAVMINKAMIEIPAKFQDRPPVNPAAKSLIDAEWQGAQGLANDIAYYGKLLKEKAFAKIGHLYPKVKIPETGQEATVIAWIWARTVKCPNPACGCEMPLVKSFWLSKRAGKEAYLEPIVEGGKVRFEVRRGKGKVREGTVARTGATCISCGASVPLAHVRKEAMSGHVGVQMMAIVAEAQNGRLYLEANAEHIKTAMVSRPESVPTAAMPKKALGFSAQGYGMLRFSDLFTNRQITALTIFSDIVSEIKERIIVAGGTKEYGTAVSVYLAFLVDKLADYHSIICSWHASGEKLRGTFARQAIPMVWDYAEANPFSNSSGCLDNMLEWVEKSVREMPAGIMGRVMQHNASDKNDLQQVVVSTDPPYYDNIGYANLSDYFYIWMRKVLRGVESKLFSTLQTPKQQELVAEPDRFEGSKASAKSFFEQGMSETCKQLYRCASKDVPMTIYYAFKQNDTDLDGIASSGWETMLNAIVSAGFSITGTWPVRTELSVRPRANDSNALASSIVLVCRKRDATAATCTRKNFLRELKKELESSLAHLQASNIAPVDMAQSAIGPGVSVYSRYAAVLESDGSPMTVRSALKLINQALDDYFHGQGENLDAESRFAVDLYAQCGFNEIAFGEADVLARARNVAMNRLQDMGIVHAAKGKVRLKDRDELPSKLSTGDSTWLWVQTLVRELGGSGIEGCAKRLSEVISSGEGIKHLAYRLYQIADKKGWAQEGTGYNNLVISWPDIMTRREELRNQQVEVMSFDF